MSLYIFPIAFLFIIYGCNCTVGHPDDGKAKVDFNILIKAKEPQPNDSRRANTDNADQIADNKVDETINEVETDDAKVDEANKDVNYEENVVEVNKEVKNEETSVEAVNKIKEQERVAESSKETKDGNDKKQEDSRRAHRGALRMKDENKSLLPKTALRIRGGTKTEPGDKNFPYVAAIIVNGRLWCTGSIVDENWVLTAAHCLNYVLHVSPMNTLSKFVKIRVGSSDPMQGGTEYEVFGAVRHPKFEEEPVPHADVALLKLTDNIALNDMVNIIKLYEHTTEPFYESFILVPGFGAASVTESSQILRNCLFIPTANEQSVSKGKTKVMVLERHEAVTECNIKIEGENVEQGSDTHFLVKDQTQELKSARLRVRDEEYCSAAHQLVNGFQFTQDFFCASFRNGTRDACLFDAGAPAVQRNRLLGVMSFGPERCGDSVMPAVFVKTFFFRDFVRNTIQAYKTTRDLIEAMKEVNSDADHDMDHEQMIVVTDHPMSEGYNGLTADMP